MIPLTHIKVGNKIVHPNKKDVLIITAVYNTYFNAKSFIQYKYKEWDTWTAISNDTTVFCPYYDFKDYLKQLEKL